MFSRPGRLGALTFKPGDSSPQPGHCSQHQKPHSPPPLLPFPAPSPISAPPKPPLRETSAFSPQDFQSDPFRHLSAYLYLSLVMVQFALSCLADQAPLFPKRPPQAVSHHVSNQSFACPCSSSGPQCPTSDGRKLN